MANTEDEWIIYQCSSYLHRRGALYMTDDTQQQWSDDIDEAAGFRLKREALRISGDYIVKKRGFVRRLPM